MDEPIEITSESDIRKINQIRRAVFGGTGDEPLKHVGEAQTCYVIMNWTGVRWLRLPKSAEELQR